MIDETVFNTIIGAAGEGQIERLIGAILVAVVAIIRYVTRDRFSLEVGSWISAVSALCGGVGAALLAGAVWWHALLIGLVVAPSSKGFWDRIRSLLPKRKGLPPSIPPTGVLLVFLTTLSLMGVTGCTVRKAQAGVQSALTSSAEAVAAADAIVADGIPDAADQARAEVQSRIDAGEELEPLEAYRVIMQPWYRAADGLEATRIALTAAQAGLTIWIGSGELPEDWNTLCGGVGTAVAALTGLLEAIGVSVPDKIEDAQGLIGPACAMVANAF